MECKALVKYISSLLLFGLNGIVASHIPLNSYEIVFLRTFIGSIFLITLFLVGKGKFHIKEYKKDTVFICLSGIAMGTSWMFLYEAYQQIGVSLASLLYSCGPVIVMVLSPVIFREKLTIPKVAGFMIVLVGICFVNGDLAGDGSNIWGLFCGAMSALMYFFMVTFNKQAKSISGMENSIIQLAVSFLTVAVFMGVKQGLIITISANAWIWILILGIVNTGVGCYMYFSSLVNLSVQTVAVCSYLELLSAVVFAALLLGERMTIIQIIGAVCIIGGAMIGELVKSKKS
ncbi:MAG: EamA family transporter [Lachnospiraceae bacterium]|nr:EamA family transporter [Lachnospiraceae bacterium]